MLPYAGSEPVRGDYFSSCYAVLRYKGQVRDAILRYKFRGTQAYADAFGGLVAELILGQYTGRYDILTWVPLSRDRKRRRGYDQAELIAENAAARLWQTAVPVLKKRRGVHPQSKAGDHDRRRTNIAGAYQVIDPAAVAGRRILIIDDIVTTASTLSECARTLLLAGADEVMCAVLASANE